MIFSPSFARNKQFNNSVASKIERLQNILKINIIDNRSLHLSVYFACIQQLGLGTIIMNISEIHVGLGTKMRRGLCIDETAHGVFKTHGMLGVNEYLSRSQTFPWHYPCPSSSVLWWAMTGWACDYGFTSAKCTGVGWVPHIAGGGPFILSPHRIHDIRTTNLPDCANAANRSPEAQILRIWSVGVGFPWQRRRQIK